MSKKSADIPFSTIFVSIALIVVIVTIAYGIVLSAANLKCIDVGYHGARVDFQQQITYCFIEETYEVPFQEAVHGER